MQDNQEHNQSDFGAFSFLKVKKKQAPEGYQNKADQKNLLPFFLLPFIGVCVIAFIVLYKVLGIGNPSLLIGLFLIIWAIFELKYGVALSIIPFSQHFGSYFYFKDKNEGLYGISMAGHFLVGIILVVVGLFAYLK